MFQGEKGVWLHRGVTLFHQSEDVSVKRIKEAARTGANRSTCSGLMPFGAPDICVTSLAFDRERHFLGQMGTDSRRSDKTVVPSGTKTFRGVGTEQNSPPHDQSNKSGGRLLCWRPGGDISAPPNKPVKDVGK